MVDEIEDSYFSEREGVVPTAEEAEIGQSFWAGFVALVSQRIGNNGFAENFPLCCSDTGLPHDTDVQALGCLFSAEVHSLKWPLDPGAMPQTADVLDSAEFFWRHVSEVTDRRGHSSRRWGFQHDHFIAFDRALGRSNYRSDVNQLLRRCAHPYFLDDCGKARRRLAATVQTIIRKTQFRTGDAELDRLLVEACEKFESPDLTVQREALERLWDSWERLKSLMLPDKADSTKKLLDEFMAEPQLRQKVESDARDLTWREQPHDSPLGRQQAASRKDRTRGLPLPQAICADVICPEGQGLDGHFMTSVFQVSAVCRSKLQLGPRAIP